MKMKKEVFIGPIRMIGFLVRCGCFLVASLLLVCIAEAQIGVSPPRTEFLLDGPLKTHSIRVFNLGEKSVDVAVEINHWDLDEENNVRILPPTEQSLDQWLVVNPLRFKLEGGGSQAVRFAARPRVQPEPGEHRALIYFSQVPDEGDPGKPAQPQVLFRLGTSVIGLAEPVIRDAVIHSVTADETAVRFDVESRGNTHVRLDGQWVLWLAEAFPGHDNTTVIEGIGEDEKVVLPEGIVVASLLNSMPVLPGTRRVVTTQIGHDLEPGIYFLDLHGNVAGTEIGRAIEIEVAAGDETEGMGPSDEGEKEEVGEADRSGEEHQTEPTNNG